MDAEPVLAGQVALVTGAATGLGRRFAETLARHGAAVAIAGRRVDRLQEAADAIGRAGGTALPVVLDVRDAAAIEATLDGVTEALGLPSILVNNAGVPDARRAHRMPLELVDAVLETNLRGPWLLATSLAARLIAAERPGRIVNISSMSAFQYGGEGAALYSVTKAAVNRMTEVLAVEWAARGINVNAIAPGAFASEMMDGMLERMGDITAGYPRRRLGDPAMLDSTLLHLVSPASEYVTGTVVKVDDGQLPR
ncbi:SDR family oxidoreductase [Nocardioides dongxiaopingii]|uniref:SDR family NAD(P)-dependent oxidoreductase n=1 Tax=Nocardioides TaxID=1839 RepID=UPI0010C7634E|nr:MULTISPECIES: SDR family NAD(P)-dependent oxidoreductase [Nocardioides]QCW51919.1 SDR family oxidoreductase [Nocardioides sp. S-1144]